MAQEPTLASGFVLKLLSGLHSGAEARLMRGRYTIGTAEDCDIIVGDAGAPHHAVLTVDAQRVEIAPLEGPVDDGRGAAITGPTALEAFRPVRLGGVFLAVAPTGQRWPTIALPTAPAMRPETPRPAPTETLRSPGARGSAAPKPPLRPPSAAPRSGLAVRALSGAALVVVAVGLVLTLVGFGPQEAAVTPTPDPVQTVQALIAERGLAERLKARRMGERTIAISGYMELSGQRRELMDMLGGKSIEIVDRIVAEDVLLGQAQRQLDAAGTKLTAVNLGQGRIALRGFADSEGAVGATGESLRETVPGIRSVTNQTVSAEALVEELDEQLRRRGLGNRIALSREGKVIVATGAPEPTELAAWDGARTEFLQRRGDLIEVRAAFNQRADRTPLQVKAVISGPIPFVVTVDGRRVYPGEDVGGGYRLSEIRAGDVVLTRNGQTIVQSFGK